MDLRLQTHPAVGLPDGSPGVPTATVIEVGGELDLHSASQLREEVARVIESYAPGAGVPRIVIELSGVSFLDSTGVGALVGALKRAREAGGELHFCGAQSRVRRVFEITGLIGALPLFGTRQEAMATFNSDRQSNGQSAPEGGAIISESLSDGVSP